ncbi:B-cell receptor CD22-like [Pungitius pungitius]|uniref:B-cell receptor CD22-like n=1 Tax=Pungitius pungitius TaxID=134920 RepID=UPI002E102F77
MDQVEPNDAGQFFFRFTTNSTDGKWTGKHGPTLKVVDSKIIVKQPEGIRATKEGDSVNLTCMNAFDDRRPSCAFTWFKNGEPINQGPVLYLSNLSSKNSGNYACSLKGHPQKTSGVVNINVEHGPKNTSVSVRASMEGDFSRNVTLICSSHANPPVEDYTWFKVDDEDDDIMDVGPRPEFLPADGGQYFCGATNKHGSQNSSVVTVKIGTYWATFTRDVIIFAAVAVLLTVITVVALSSLYKKRIWIPKPDSEDDIQNTDYVNWLPHANHHPQEGPPCEGGTEDVTYSTVYFKKKTKSNMELPMDSRSRDDEGVIYICVSENSR